MIVTCIKNTQTGEYFESNGRSCWSKSGSAKNAWNAKMDRWRLIKFDEQSLWVCVTCEVVPISL